MIKTTGYIFKPHYTPDKKPRLDCEGNLIEIGDELVYLYSTEDYPNGKLLRGVVTGFGDWGVILGDKSVGFSFSKCVIIKKGETK